MSAPQGLPQERPVEKQLTNEEVQPCPKSLYPADYVDPLFKKQGKLVLIFEFTPLTWKQSGDEVTVMLLYLDVHFLEDEFCFCYFGFFLKRVLQPSQTSLRLPSS